MRSQLVRTLANGAVAVLLTSGAAVASSGTAFAAPTPSDSVTAGQQAPMAKKCHHVKGYYRTAHSHGKTTKVWVKPHKACSKK
jgi:hypothetical protein